ncbi:hypothetical protein KKC1_03060 [Calderihabitans maritimus]|uniref:Uncharacterized protein n=1 Tax=Calderihabitans maritimus TaxID=1246530 RepID=A0A1Z5HNR2_9FIRM|nr:hypothetical protein KKC1_03060 [Calderihabitans maritimus]
MVDSAIILIYFWNNLHMIERRTDLCEKKVEDLSASNAVTKH